MAGNPNEKHNSSQNHSHQGRREKLRRRFLHDGLNSFNESEVLELALSFCIPRLDTNPTAHQLLNKFGNLSTVLEADPRLLASAYGIGENASVFLHFIQEMMRYVAKQRLSTVRIQNSADAVTFLAPLVATYPDETLLVVCLDLRDNVKGVFNFSNRDLDRVEINYRELLTFIITTKAGKLVLAHNHLNGNPKPSVADMNLTRDLHALCSPLAVQICDHVIFAPQHAPYSFYETGLLSKLFYNL